MIGYHLNFSPVQMTFFRKQLLLWREKTSLFLQNFLKREYSPRALAFLFLFALGAGSAIKALANDSLTIGFDDYTISRSANITDLNALEKHLIQTKSTLAERQVTPTGETCTEERE